MAAEEIVDSVHRARADALRPLPWPGRRDDRERRTETLRGGVIRYFLGAFFVDVAPDGAIVVNRDDWLSKYALAIEGTLDVRGKFLRVADGKEIPIDNENLIRTGEILVHRRTAETQRINARLGDSLMLQAPARSPDPGKRAEALLEKQNQLMMRDIARQGIAPMAGAAQKIDQEAIDRLIQYAERILPDVAKLQEAEKELLFLADANATTAVLLYEFATGEGRQRRHFDAARHPIAQALSSGRITDEILKVFALENAGATAVENLVSLDDKFRSYAFSPDHAPLAESFDKHVGVLDQRAAGNEVELFVGGASYKVSVDAANEMLNVLVRDAKSRSSLQLHLAGDRERVAFEKTPLGTTEQDYTFSVPIPWELIHDAR